MPLALVGFVADLGENHILRAITGQIPIAAGSVHLFGIDLAEKPELAKRTFGYAIDPLGLPATLTGTQYLKLVSSIRGCASNEWFRADLIELLALGQWLQLRIGEYS